MFDKTIAKVKGWLTRMGIIKQLKTIKEHKDINVDDKAYDRIAKNKAIYSGYLPEWHDIEFRTSAGKKESATCYQWEWVKRLLRKWQR